MFQNIGGKIKLFALILFVLAMIANVVTGIAIHSFWGVKYWLIPIIILVGGCISFFASSMLYGFGELIEKVTRISDKLEDKEMPGALEALRHSEVPHAVKQAPPMPFEALLDEAREGNAWKQYELAERYSEGMGIAKNAQEAVKWYHAAARQGLAVAQNSLGYCYDAGEGVAANPAEAFKWYRAAAEQGLHTAQYNLAECYENGVGVASDLDEAKRWYRLAATSGDQDAQQALHRLEQ